VAVLASGWIASRDIVTGFLAPFGESVRHRDFVRHSGGDACQKCTVA